MSTWQDVMAWVLKGPLGSFHDRFRRSLDVGDEAPPPSLYHYTSAEGALGVVDSQTIWGSDARYLNDTGELTYINKVVAAAAGDLRPNYGACAATTFLEAVAMDLFDAHDTRIYVACFCARGNQLSQWRSYARSGGFALGFDAQAMKLAAPLLLRKVRYEKAEQVLDVRRVLAFFCDWLSGLTVDDGWRTSLDSLALLEARHVLAECMFTFKDQAFRDEEEWRLVQVVQGEVASSLAGHAVNEPVHFRTGPYGLVPYIKMRPSWQLPRVSPLLPIRDVVVGPGTHQALAKDAMRTLLTVAGHDHEVTVCSSDVTLRA